MKCLLHVHDFHTLLYVVYCNSSKISPFLFSEVEFSQRIFRGKTEKFPVAQLCLTKITELIQVDKIITHA